LLDEGWLQKIRILNVCYRRKWIISTNIAII